MLLKIAWRLESEGIKQHAIAELTARKDSVTEGLPPTEQILMALCCDIPSWLEPAYAKLVYDPAPLTVDVAVKLPPEIAIVLSRVRELYYHRDNWTWVSNYIGGRRVHHRHSWSSGMTATTNVKWVSAHRRSAEEIVKEPLALLGDYQWPRDNRERYVQCSIEVVGLNTDVGTHRSCHAMEPSKRVSRSTI